MLVWLVLVSSPRSRITNKVWTTFNTFVVETCDTCDSSITSCPKQMVGLKLHRPLTICLGFALIMVPRVKGEWTLHLTMTLSRQSPIHPDPACFVRLKDGIWTKLIFWGFFQCNLLTNLRMLTGYAKNSHEYKVTMAGDVTWVTVWNLLRNIWALMIRVLATFLSLR